MSQRLHYLKTVHGPVLQEQLIAAIPALAPAPGADGQLTAVMMLESSAAECWVTVPDSVAAADVDAVVAAHDPAKPLTRTLAERRAAKAAIVRERAVAEAT